MRPVEAANAIVTTLTERGFQAFLVGGCVRDLVLEREPKDFDVTTSATPEQVQAIFPKTLAVGAAFGVVIVVDGENQTEVATFRTDGQYSDGRRPDTVAYSTNVQHDVTRRDFTMNGLLMGPNGVVDYVGGLQDIDNRSVRCIGNPETRFTEDPVRMLRAARFAAQLGFNVEYGTFDAIVKLRDTIQRVSRERIALELQKLVTAPFAYKGVEVLLSTGLMEATFGAKFVAKTRFDLMLKRFGQHFAKDPVKGLAMLFVDTDFTVVGDVLKTLKLSTEQAVAVFNALTTSETLMLTTTVAEQKRLARRPGFLAGVDLFEQNGGSAGLIAFFRALTPEEIKPTPFLTGDDLVARGLQPGPEFGRILTALETEQLEGRVTNREEAEAFYERLAVH